MQNQRGTFLAFFLNCAFLMPLLATADAILQKSVRVRHGSPVVLVSQNSVLVLEFLTQSAADALVPESDPDTRHAQAKYRFKVYDPMSGLVTTGQGTVHEIYKTVSRSPTGNQVVNVGSRTAIRAGEFSLRWSEGTAGQRSWINYGATDPIRFVQQPKEITFDSLDEGDLRAYLGSTNIREFLEAGKRVQVIGPAIFSDDLPSDSSVGRIDSGQVRDNIFELRLSGLATNRHYIVENSYELKTATWLPRHTFIAHAGNYRWSDPLAKDAELTFYRIRQAAY